jgi:hypothetical protein
MKMFVRYVFGDEDSFPTVTGLEIGGICLVVATVSVKKLGDAGAKAREAREYVASLAGMSYDAMLKDKEMKAEYVIYVNALQRWARCLPATVAVQVCAPGQSMEDAVWRESSLEALGLHKPERALELPNALLEAWDLAVQQANEGVFAFDETDPAQKKSGKVSAA